MNLLKTNFCKKFAGTFLSNGRGSTENFCLLVTSASKICCIKSYTGDITFNPKEVTKWLYFDDTGTNFSASNASPYITNVFITFARVSPFSPLSMACCSTVNCILYLLAKYYFILPRTCFLPSAVPERKSPFSGISFFTFLFANQIPVFFKIIKTSWNSSLILLTAVTKLLCCQLLLIVQIINAWFMLTSQFVICHFLIFDFSDIAVYAI